MTHQAVSARVSRRLFGADHRARLENERPPDANRLMSIVDALDAPRPRVQRAGDAAGLASMWQNAGMGLLRTIVDSTADHIHVKDLDGRYLLVNRADAELFGMTVDDILGLTDADIIDPDEAAMVRERDLFVLESGEPLSYEQETTLDGVVHTWLTTKNVIRDPAGKASGIFTISHEVTEQRRQEAQLRHAAKMDAVGQLAGGIAHDFNNMLTAIQGYTSLVREGLSSEDEQARADLEQVTMAADRAAELTRQLLAFSRRQVLAPRVLDPVEIVQGIAPMLRRLLGEDIDLAIEGEPGAGQILVDPAQLEQVILNLALNARDAMPDGGRLLIETANADLDDEYVGNHPGVSAGPHVRLAVSDIGSGMDPATLERIFEPFFTTKEAGKGTGLGLSTVHGIVNQSDGWIYVYSEPGYGTTFHVYFPRVPGNAVAIRETTTGPVPTGGETILLVEDEPAVRGFARRALGRLGYEVLEAGNGREAVAVAAAYDGPIDLLLTDVIMPGMHGAALSAELTGARRTLRTLFVSGFPEDSIVRHGVLKDNVAYLPKPFSAAALGHAVRAVLDRQA